MKQELAILLVNEVRCWLDSRDHSQISLLHLPVTSTPELTMSVVPAVRAYGVIIEGCLLIEAVSWMNLDETARSRAEGPEFSLLHSLRKGQRVSVSREAPTQTEELAPLRSYRRSIHCILLRSLKVILPGLRNSIRRR